MILIEKPEICTFNCFRITLILELVHGALLKGQTGETPRHREMHDFLISNPHYSTLYVWFPLLIMAVYAVVKVLSPQQVLLQCLPIPVSPYIRSKICPTLQCKAAWS
jgi:hypothetical protein